jgi:hypothetical protein
MFGRSSTPRPVRRIGGLVGLAVAAALIVPSAAFAQQGILTESVFNNAPGSLTDLYQPVFLYELGANTNYFQDASFTNGSSDTASSTVTLAALSTNPDGSTNALWIFKVSGATKTYQLGGVACNTQSGYSQCYTGVTIPAGTQTYDFRLTRSFQDASTGNYWWNAALMMGNTQKNAGLIEVPGGTTTIDNGIIIDQVQYVGTATSCALTPQSNISFFEPFQGSSYGVYDGSLAANGTCNTTFTPLNLGGHTTGVNVVAPSS